MNVQEAAQYNEVRQYSKEIDRIKDDLPDQFPPYPLSKSDHKLIHRFNKLGAARFRLQRKIATEKVMESLDKYTIVNVKRGSELASKGFPVGKELWMEHKIYVGRKPVLLRVSIPIDWVPSCVIRTFDLPILRVQVLLSGVLLMGTVILNVTDSHQTANAILTSAILQAGGAVEAVAKLPAYFEGVIDTFLSGITPFTPYYNNLDRVLS